MSSVKSKKLPRNDQSMLNYDIKKRTTENKSFPKKDAEKKNQKEDEKQKTKIDWEEEKDILKKYLSEKYPLSNKKIENIINERDKAKKKFGSVCAIFPQRFVRAILQLIF